MVEATYRTGVVGVRSHRMRAFTITRGNRAASSRDGCRSSSGLISLTTNRKQRPHRGVF